MNIAIITGGVGPERNISIQSANNIRQHINFSQVELFLYPEEYDKYIGKKHFFDIVIPMIHGIGGEDGELQEKLENNNTKYIFSESAVHKKCFDKDFAKKFGEKAGFNIPKSFLFSEIKDENFRLLQSLEKMDLPLEFIFWKIEKI